MRSERLRRILLVARHEFLQTVGNKAFLFTLVLVPFMIVASALVPRWIKDRAISPPSVAIVDLTGRYESVLGEELAARRAKRELAALGAWVRANLADVFLIDGRPDPNRLPSLLLKRRSDITPADIAEFRRRGGVAGLLPVAMAFVRSDTKPFLPPPRRFELVPLPPGLAGLAAERDLERLRERARPYLEGRERLADGRRLEVLAVIPPAISLLSPDDPARYARPDPDRSLQIWAAGPGAEAVDGALGDALATIMRAEALNRAGITPAIRAALAADLPVQRLDLRSSTGRERRASDVIRDFLPRGFAFVLIYFLMLQASLLMGHMMEERQSRVLEVLVSTMSPQALLAGKLLGGAAVSLLSLAGLMTFTLLALRLIGPGEMMVLLRIVADALADPRLVALLFSQFLLGFLFFANLFVVAGALSLDQRGAQILLMPLMLMLLAMMPAVIVLGDDPTSPGARIASFLPGLGPFMLVARHDAGLGLGEILLADLVQLVAIAGVIWGAGHLFRLAILEGGLAARLGPRHLLSRLRGGGGAAARAGG